MSNPRFHEEFSDPPDMEFDIYPASGVEFGYFVLEDGFGNVVWRGKLERFKSQSSLEAGRRISLADLLFLYTLLSRYAENGQEKMEMFVHPDDASAGCYNILLQPPGELR